jgi:hypothetical protein
VSCVATRAMFEHKMKGPGFEGEGSLTWCMHIMLISTSVIIELSSW